MRKIFSVIGLFVAAVLCGNMSLWAAAPTVSPTPFVVSTTQEIWVTSDFSALEISGSLAEAPKVCYFPHPSSSSDTRRIDVGTFFVNSQCTPSGYVIGRMNNEGNGIYSFHGTIQVPSGVAEVGIQTIVTSDGFYYGHSSPRWVAVQSTGSGSAPQGYIGAVEALPSTISAGVETVVTVTAVISGETANSNGVNLVRGGRTIGQLYDDGRGADRTAGDKVFTGQVTFNETNPGIIELQASAAFQGQMRRVLSDAITVRVEPADGQIVGYVRDAVTNLPVSNALVAISHDTELFDHIMTDASGRFTISALSGIVYGFEISHEDYLTATYANVSILPNEIKTLDVILQVNRRNAGYGIVGGMIYNALTGAAVPELSIRLRAGLNATTGTVVATTTTDRSGAYWINDLLSGNYTAEVSGAGYITAYFPILCVGGATTPGQNGVISQAMAGDQIRVVLTWGATPSDLDSHFFGPLENGSRFHIYFANKQMLDVNLDIDDTSSYGPETTTLYQQIPGVYRFAVHDYSNRSSSSSTTLSLSQAQVRVYSGDTLIGTFNVPVGVAGTVWTVFELEGTVIRPINTMGFESDPSALRRSSAPQDSIGNLPEK